MRPLETSQTSAPTAPATPAMSHPILPPDSSEVTLKSTAEQTDIASRLKMVTCENVSLDDATRMGLYMLMSVWVLRESGGKKKVRFVAREIEYSRGCNAEHHVISIVFDHCISVHVETFRQ